MTEVTLRPMSAAEFELWRPLAIASYGHDLRRFRAVAAELADDRAKQQFAELLPEGVSTPGHHVLVAEFGGDRVGYLWLHVPGDIPGGDGGAEAFVFDIEVDEAFRGRGLGRAVMVAGETFARARGATAMRLRVFHDNVVARRLYETLGFTTTDSTMIKTLGGA